MKAPRAVEWTPEQVARFWDYWGTRTDRTADYFSAWHGHAVAALLAQAVPLAGRSVLDFGSGPGHLVPRLLQQGARVAAADASPETVRLLQERFGSEPGWLGAVRVEALRTSWPDASFDVICCLEVVEHLKDDQLAPLLTEIRRLLKPGGVAVFSTPNEEDLSHREVICPDCGAVFHARQHVRAWDADSLNAGLSRAGFAVVFCRGVDIVRFGPRPRVPFKDWSLRRAYAALRRAFFSWADRLFPRPFPCGRLFHELISTGATPNLIAVARRNDAHRVSDS